MTNRTITITSACKVSTRNEQIVILLPSGEEETVPAEDIACLMIESQEATISIPAINKLTDYNAAVVICDGKHSPNSMLLTLHANSVQTERFARQLKMDDITKDELWKQIVQAKISNQADTLYLLSKNGDNIAKLTNNVLSGDTSNVEGHASRLYWRELFGKDFRRDRFGDGPNPVLNYGYTILRSATTRALMCAGLYPCFGLHHRNRYDDFCLADDIMEPYRVFVDLEVFKMWCEGKRYTDKEVKQRLQSILYCETVMGKSHKQMISALTDTCSSLVNAIEDKSSKILFPQIC